MTDSSFCRQRTIMQLYNKPLPRVDLNSINPYLSGKYTKAQLDMRRKAEVLKYSSSRVSTQTNNMTKSQQFAMLMRGTYVQPNENVLSAGNVQCAADRMIPTPTSSCDVPGPITYLYDDETVPLYNLTTYNLVSRPEYVPNTSTPWQFVAIPDLSLNTGIETTSNYLILYNSIDNPSYTYTITIPVGISVSGTSQSAGLSSQISVGISSATLRSYYLENLYGTYSSPSFDSSMNMTFDVSSSTPGTFSASVFVGNMTFSKVILYTSPTFVYSFTTQINLTVPSSANLTYDANNYFGSAGLSYKAILNMSAGTNSSSGPIHLLSDSHINPNIGSFISGI